MGQPQKRLVSIFLLFVTLLLLIVIQVLSWSNEDCPKEEWYYERPIGDCEEMGGAFVCQQTCLSTFRGFLRATCDYSGTQTRTRSSFQYPCRCCIKQQMNFLPGHEYRGDDDSLPPEEWIPSELSASALTETFFHTCPVSHKYHIIGDCQILNKDLCVEICRQTFRALFSAFCLDQYIEDDNSSWSPCVCCYSEPLAPGSEFLPITDHQNYDGKTTDDDLPQLRDETTSMMRPEDETISPPISNE